MTHHAQRPPRATRALPRLGRPAALSLVLSALGALGACEEPCAAGQSCERSCPAGMAPVCVANALCECVNGMGGAAAAGVTVGGVTVAGSMVAGVAVGPAPMCAPPPAGALVLNEVMANPQGE